MPATRRFLHRLRVWHGGPPALLIGTVLVAAGLLQTTTATQTVGCPVGTMLIAKFEFSNNRYEFEKPDGNENVVVITNGTADGGDWRSTIAVSAIVVKGGTAAVVTWFDPPQTEGHFSGGSILDVTASGNTPDISNVQFCGQGSSGTTTTAPSTTTTSTTTAPSTTTASTTTAPSTTSVNFVTSTSVVVLGASAQNPERTSLPRTGAPSIPMVVLGIVLMAIGATLTIVGGARDRRRI